MDTLYALLKHADGINKRLVDKTFFGQGYDRRNIPGIQRRIIKQFEGNPFLDEAITKKSSLLTNVYELVFTNKYLRFFGSFDSAYIALVMELEKLVNLSDAHVARSQANYIDKKIKELRPKWSYFESDADLDIVEDPYFEVRGSVPKVSMNTPLA